MTDDSAFRFARRHGLTAYVPTALFAISESMVIPYLPVLAMSRGMASGTAAFAASLLLLGQLGGNLPSAALVRRFGERRSMMLAGSTAFFALTLIGISAHVSILLIGCALLGASAAVFALARHALIADLAAPAIRGRALSILGGAFRIGFFIGPALGAAIVAWTGAIQGSVVVAACFAAASICIVWMSVDTRAAVPAARPSSSAGYARTLWRHRRVIGTVGVGTAVVASLRAVRLVLIPLWGTLVLDDPVAVSLVFAMAGLIEVTLFYLGGVIMDRLGRFWAAVPSAGLMAAAFLALATIPESSLPIALYLASVCALAIANGVSSGLLLTLSADNMPADDPQTFLAVWRLVADVGGATLPAAVSAVVATASLAAGTFLAGGVGVLGTLLLAASLSRRHK